MRVVALLATYNEERFVGGCLEHLAAQGVETYVLDNGSTDGTCEIVRSFRDRGVIGLETIPRHGAFKLSAQLQRKQELAAELTADWFLHVDADEIRLAPATSTTLAQALAEQDEQGFNAVGFQEFVFVPTREAPDHDHPDFRGTMRWYYPFRRPDHRRNAWKRQPGGVDLVSSGGHGVRFAGMRPSPHAFPMRHYLFLSVAHAVRKYVNRHFDREELTRGWHTWRAHLRADDIVLPSHSQLRAYVGDDRLDASKPRRQHHLAELIAARATPGAERDRPDTGQRGFVTPR